jgi:beta-N-acetylhexosaminidase
MVRFWRIGWVLLLLASLWFSGAGELSISAYQPSDQAQAILDAMTVEERVGQLFLVSFEGDSINQNSDIADLILNYKIGGVFLLPANDNFSGYGNPNDTPQQVAELTSALQKAALLAELPAADTDETDAGREAEAILTPPPPPLVGVALPLFVTMNHEGNPFGENRTLGGLTGVPTNMAVGATWQPRYAQGVGRIVGRELAAVGVNMLLGPALDVLENPDPSNLADLGTISYGGHPYWVGLMGKAYTEGVHLGSQDRVAVIAKHFPGIGSSDRATDAEVPTVRKSLEQLKQVELAPFVAVTGETLDDGESVDGLLTTHIRYQGFQGNIRASTAPVSFDPQALAALMALPEFAPWRQSGGVIVSDSLGVRSIARVYDDTEQDFPHRQIAKDAFLAGNDLLTLSDFALGDAPYADQSANIRDTVLWFREKYETDQSFQQHVDEAALRIIQLKLRLYDDDFSVENVVPNPNDLVTNVGQGDPVIFDLAQTSTTLISPSIGDLAERVASPPGAGDKIIVFTDVRETRQCSSCPLEAIVSETALADRMVALYGPDASGQLQPTQIESFSFIDLDEFLDAGTEPIFLPTAEPISTLTFDEAAQNPTPVLTPTPPADFLVQEALRGANWIIFSLLDNGASSPSLSRFLVERPDIVRDANVIVFALDAPYYLDTTEISKLTAFYGIYSTTDMFIDTAVRALFQEGPLSGKSPVSIEGISYNLVEQTQPDPEQIIELYILSGDDVQAPPSQAPLDAAVGDTLQLQTGVIRDRNGNSVPDGTIVQFVQRDRIQGTVSIITEAPTKDGTARLDYVLEARTGPGQFRITAVAGEANISQEVDISIEDEAQVAIIVPTAVPTATATPTHTPTATAAPSATPTPPPTATPLPILPPEEPGIRIALSELEMLLTLFTGLIVVVTGTLFLGSSDDTVTERAGGLLWAVIGALLFYIYYMLELPGSGLIESLGNWSGLLTTLIGGAAGWLLYQAMRNYKISLS